MWLRFVDLLRCPMCKGSLELAAFDCAAATIPPVFLAIASDRGIRDARFDQYVESGLLLCSSCRAMFPVLDGLPIMLCYSTPIHTRFLQQHGGRITESY